MLSESQNVGYKESWRDEYQKWICDFANAYSGRIYIGVNDNKLILKDQQAIEELALTVRHFIIPKRTKLTLAAGL